MPDTTVKTTTEDEQEIADTFNKFFVDKVANLKNNIALTMVF